MKNDLGQHGQLGQLGHLGQHGQHHPQDSDVDHVAKFSTVAKLAKFDEAANPISDSKTKVERAEEVESRGQISHVGQVAGQAFCVTIRSDGEHPVPVEVRLRAFLKIALRRWGLRCVSISQTAARGLP